VAAIEVQEGLLIEENTEDQEANHLGLLQGKKVNSFF